MQNFTLRYKWQEQADTQNAVLLPNKAKRQVELCSHADGFVQIAALC